jgi:hypothetical protein
VNECNKKFVESLMIAQKNAGVVVHEAVIDSDIVIAKTTL